MLGQSPRFQIAHCPSSHTFFGHSPFALQRLQKLGFNICLGTDSLASNSSLSLFSEMRSLLREEPSVSAREALEMATINGARAIGQGDALGGISAGRLADLVAIPADSERNAYDTIVAFEGKNPLDDGQRTGPIERVGFLVFASFFSILKYSPRCDYG